MGRLRKFWADTHELVLIDRNRFSEFLPLLPDLISERISRKSLRRDLDCLCRKNGARFEHDEIVSFDPAKRKIHLMGAGDVGFEYLVVSIGAEVNFFGEEELRETCFKLYSSDDAETLKEALLSQAGEKSFMRAFIIGGGYTGIEIAANIELLARKKKINSDITIVERSDKILGSVPGWVREASVRKLKELGIKIRYEESLESYGDGTARFSSGDTVEETICVWAAGVKPSECAGTLDLEKGRSRVKVLRDLRATSDPSQKVFFCGDVAAYEVGGEALRMAVMFSMGQGRSAACNIVRSIRGRPLAEYVAVDLGYLVPFATGSAYGPVMFFKAKGFFGYLLHYFMCFYRSSFRNKITLLKEWFLRSECNKKGGRL